MRCRRRRADLKALCTLYLLIPSSFAARCSDMLASASLSSTSICRPRKRCRHLARYARRSSGDGEHRVRVVEAPAACVASCTPTSERIKPPGPVRATGVTGAVCFDESLRAALAATVNAQACQLDTDFPAMTASSHLSTAKQTASTTTCLREVTERAPRKAAPRITDSGELQWPSSIGCSIVPRLWSSSWRGRQLDLKAEFLGFRV